MGYDVQKARAGVHSFFNIDLIYKRNLKIACVCGRICV